MEKEWMKLIDDVENDRSYNADPNFKFVDFIREKSTIEDKRAIVQEVERRIKKVVNREENNPDYFFRNFSATTWTVRFDSSMLTKTRSCIWRMMTITVPTSTI